MIPRIYPADMSSPVDIASPIGYVTSTPNSNPTGIIGIIVKPIMKQNSAVSHIYSDINAPSTPIILKADVPQMIITASLYLCLFSTQKPNTPEPISPPIIKTAPKTAESSYTESVYKQ